ncbi:MAG: hypothetical protein ACE5OR_14300 [bacterium]
MSFLEILGSIVAGAGTFASILGVLLAKASRENGKATRELIASENKATRELMERMSEKLGALIAGDGERTRAIIKEILVK